MLNLFEKKTKETFTSFPYTRNSNFIYTDPSNINDSNNNIGETRHFPPANKEWKNSIYSYNKNYIKTLPIVDNLVNKLIKSYFNLSTLFNKKKSSRVQVRFKRLSLNRILVSKADMKHTNNKVIITVYLYNRNKKFLFNKLKKLSKLFIFKTIPSLNKSVSSKDTNKNVFKKRSLFSKNKNIFSLNKNLITKQINKAKTLVTHKRINSNNLKNSTFIKKNQNLSKYTTKRFKSSNMLYKLRNLHKLFVISKMYNNNNINTLSNISQKNHFSPFAFALGLKNKFFLLKNLSQILKKKSGAKAIALGLNKSFLLKKINIVSLKGSRIIRKVRKHKNFILKTLKWNNKNFLNYENNYYKNFISKSYKKEMLYLYYVQMLSFNHNKKKNWFLLGLKKIISKIYHKKVEFNFVNLKYLHLNSDIFSDSIAIKLRNRENRLLRVLKKALKLVKLPSLNKLSFFDKKITLKFINKYKTLNLNTFISIMSKDKDVLHELLYKIFPNMEKSKHSDISQRKSGAKAIAFGLQKNILNSIKHKAIYGVRLEATGRLSRRLTASRSVFKLKYKGSLKNIDSSYKNLSSVMLRGNTKPNIQYTKISSKTRNGSFGLKGWVSSY